MMGATEPLGGSVTTGLGPRVDVGPPKRLTLVKNPKALPFTAVTSAADGEGIASPPIESAIAITTGNQPLSHDISRTDSSCHTPAPSPSYGHQWARDYIFFKSGCRCRNTSRTRIERDFEQVRTPSGIALRRYRSISRSLWLLVPAWRDS